MPLAKITLESLKKSIRTIRKPDDKLTNAAIIRQIGGGSSQTINKFRKSHPRLFESNKERSLRRKVVKLPRRNKELESQSRQEVARLTRRIEELESQVQEYQDKSQEEILVEPENKKNKKPTPEEFVAQVLKDEADIIQNMEEEARLDEEVKRRKMHRKEARQDKPEQDEYQEKNRRCKNQNEPLEDAIKGKYLSKWDEILKLEDYGFGSFPIFTLPQADVISLTKEMYGNYMEKTVLWKPPSYEEGEFLDDVQQYLSVKALEMKSKSRSNNSDFDFKPPPKSAPSAQQVPFF